MKFNMSNVEEVIELVCNIDVNTINKFMIDQGSQPTDQFELVKADDRCDYVFVKIANQYGWFVDVIACTNDHGFNYYGVDRDGKEYRFTHINIREMKFGLKKVK